MDWYQKAVALWRLGWLLIGVASDGASFGVVAIDRGVCQGSIRRCFLLSVALVTAVGGDPGSVARCFSCGRCGGDSLWRSGGVDLRVSRMMRARGIFGWWKRKWV